MNKVMKLVGTALAGGVTAFFLATATLTVPACGPETDGPTEDPKVKCEAGQADCCKTAKDCGKASEWVCASKTCIAICSKSADCGAGEICEDAVCRPPACGNDSECGGNEQCIGGACEAKVADSKVASCTVLPTNGILKDGATKAFTVVAKDTDGTTLAYKGAVEYTVDEAGRAAVAGNVVTGGAAAGTVKVSAKVGSVDCAAATVTNYAKPETGKTRIVVADLHTQQPIEGASVVVDGAEGVDTAVDGTVTIDSPANAYTISVFHDDYAWVTIVGTSSKDLLVYTKQAQDPATFTGSMTARDFDNLSDIQGTVHLALQGSSIAGNLYDLELATLLGNTAETDIDLGSIKETVPLPEGTVIGLGEQMFRGPSKDGAPGFQIVASPGVRTLWALGGNAQIGTIIEALGPVIGGGDIEIGPILSSLLPVLGRLQSGALTGLNGVANETTSIMGSDGKSKLKLDTLLRLRVEAALPKLPSYTVAGETIQFGEAVVLGGALNGSQGLVPLGLTAGIDTDKDGIVDADEEAGTGAGKLALRLAPLHSGMETSKYAVLALAASIDSLIGGAGIALSGLVTYPATLGFNEGKPGAVTVGTKFLDVPSEAAINGRVLTGSKVDGASFQRLSIGNGDAEWLVYFAPKGEAITVPAAPAGKTDRFAVAGTDVPGTLLNTVRLGLTGTAPSFDDVVSFNSANLDDVSDHLDGFSLIDLAREAVQP